MPLKENEEAFFDQLITEGRGFQQRSRRNEQGFKVQHQNEMIGKQESGWVRSSI